jgi:hypothetical protein
MFGYDEKEVLVVEKLSLNALAEVTEKLEQGKYVEADQQIETIFIQDKIWDVRYVMYYLFSQLAQNKFDTYLEFCVQANSLFTDNYELLSPVHRKEKVIQKAIDWFEKYFPDKFEQAMELFPKEQELESVANNTIKLFDAMAEKSYLVEGFQHKLNKLVNTFSLKAKLNTTDDTLVQETKEKVCDQENVVDQPEETEVRQSLRTLNTNSGVDGNQVSASVEWTRLLTLLEDYKNYTENGHSEIAYLAHLKIEKALENFNPIIYFPKVFETYLRSKVHNYSSLFHFKRKQVEEQPYAQMVNEILENNDPELRKLITEKPFEYIEGQEPGVQEYMDEDI